MDRLRMSHPQIELIIWELFSWQVDLARIDHMRIELVGVDLMRIDLVALNRTLINSHEECELLDFVFFLQEQNWWHPSNSTFLQVYIFLKSNINSSKLGPTRTVRANNSSKSAKRSNNLTTLIRFEIFQFQLLQESHDDKQIVYCNNVKQLNRTSSRASRSRAFILDRAQHA